MFCQCNHNPAFPQTSRSRVERSSAYGIAVLLALVLVIYLYPASFVLGTSGSFDQGDSPQHVSGWLLFAADDWRFPLLLTQRFAPPEGLPIFLTDSIPLAALVFKPFAPLLPEGFHYLGLWHVGLRFGQALAAVYLVRALGARDALSAFAAVGLALLWPANLARIEHTALGTHWLLLLGLGHYFRARHWSVFKAATIFTVTTSAALLVHPYLLAMILPIQIAEAVDRSWRIRKWRKPATGLAASLVWLAALAFVMGYFTAGSNLDGGFEIYSMNLLAPFCGGDILRCIVPDPTGGQREGFNYLGLGVLIAITGACILSWRHAGSALRAHPALACIMIGFVIYALSSRVWLGDWKLLSYKIPYPTTVLTETFRSSGRFFWPVGLLLMATAVATLARSGRRWMPALLVGLVVVQAVDTRSLLQSVQAHASQPPLYDFSQWRAALPAIQAIEVYPAFGCPELTKQPYSFMQRLAGEIGATINTGYLARSNNTCEAVVDHQPQPLAAGRLLVSFADAGRFPQPAIISQAIAAGSCRTITLRDQAVLMCSNDPGVNWDALGSIVQPARP
ncbi:hypothetical protein JYU29_07725 [Tianweitania sp. BSSL-BM11]|uniref:Glycosyltransferase RgtA/B/C/D-like domain-containing protein n=1 Tax=Tianweitania aestuarii TaxID=2814886 RepID=A0ABS5RW92_9HYPH|nr:DUF6311 domain-containing protein [Tianweitania aestuarii]MBS9720572.1 hypothetical protein [Tianweitania aestuarii]